MFQNKDIQIRQEIIRNPQNLDQFKIRLGHFNICKEHWLSFKMDLGKGLIKFQEKHQHSLVWCKVYNNDEIWGQQMHVKKVRKPQMCLFFINVPCLSREVCLVHQGRCGCSKGFVKNVPQIQFSYIVSKFSPDIKMSQSNNELILIWQISDDILVHFFAFPSKNSCCVYVHHHHHIWDHHYLHIWYNSISHFVNEPLVRPVSHFRKGLCTANIKFILNVRIKYTLLI